MVKTWKKATNKAESKNLISKAKVVNAHQSASKQASQISNLILQGYNAIAIDAASPTALNGVIQKACKAGVTVVTFDSLAKAPCAYKIDFNYVHDGKMEANYVAKRLNDKGNVLEVRGMPGTSVDHNIHKGIVKGLSKYPNIKIVGSVYGKWTQTVAQKQVSGILPTLPKIGAVVTQGGDGYGTYQAFRNAGRSIPIIIMGNREVELNTWHRLHQKNGYKTFSVSSIPGVGSIAFWEAQQILAGKNVPKKVTVPLLVIHQKHLNLWRKATPKGGVATPVFNQSWVVKLIDATKQGKTLPKPPLPSHSG